jgi:Mn2+/Fe2+ NRAMP family transporter
MQVLFHIPAEQGAAISAMIAIAIFLYKEAGVVLDIFTKGLGIVMILLTLYVTFTSSPPLGEALYRTVWPEKIDPRAIITLVGGTGWRIYHLCRRSSFIGRGHKGKGIIAGG